MASNPFNPSQVPTLSSIDQSLGTAFPIVRNVAENIEYIKHVSSNLTKLRMAEMVMYPSFTRLELLEIAADDIPGTVVFCIDAASGKGLVIARGNTATDWVTVKDDIAI